jgi:hypothetical protein
MKISSPGDDLPKEGSGRQPVLAGNHRLSEAIENRKPPFYLTCPQAVLHTMQLGAAADQAPSPVSIDADSGLTLFFSLSRSKPS